MPKTDLPGHHGGGVVSEIHREITAELRRDVDRHEGRLENISSQLAAASSQVGRLEGQIQLLIAAYERTTALALNQANAELEIRRTQEMAVIETRALRLKHRHAVVLKLMALLTGLGSVIAAAASHGC